MFAEDSMASGLALFDMSAAEKPQYFTQNIKISIEMLQNMDT